MHDRALITVAGQIGSGKTEVSREIARRTGWRMISAGGIVRRMAAEHGMSVLEFNEYAKTHENVDREIDGYLAGLGDLAESLVIDSRLAWHFLPGALKVYLIVEDVTGAERVFRASRSDENHASAATANVDNAERQRLERERFMSLYSLNAEDWRNYDLVVDTSSSTPDEVTDVVMKRVVSGVDATLRPECWLSPQRLVPAREVPPAVDTRGFDGAAVVDIVVHRGAFLILHGHSQTSAALRLGRPLVRCRVVAFESEEFARASPSLSVVQAWEVAHGFKRKSYPPWFQPA